MCLGLNVQISDRLGEQRVRPAINRPPTLFRFLAQFLRPFRADAISSPPDPASTIADGMPLTGGNARVSSVPVTAPIIKSYTRYGDVRV
jgi:hypothetical protein